MRCLLKVSIPVETGNAKISDGSLGKTIESILADLKPEAAYFAADNGKRTGFIFFDLKIVPSGGFAQPTLSLVLRREDLRNPSHHVGLSTSDRILVGLTTVVVLPPSA